MNSDTSTVTSEQHLLVFHEVDGVLHVHLPLFLNATPLGEEEINKQLEEGGYGDLKCDEKAIAKLIAWQHKQLDEMGKVAAAAETDAVDEEASGELSDEEEMDAMEGVSPTDDLAESDGACEEHEHTDFVIAERLDAILEISLDEDEMEARLTLTPPWGGEEITREVFDLALKKHRVTFGLNQEVIEATLAEKEADKVVISEAQPPVAGEDTRFEILFTTPAKGQPVIDSQGRADYRELGLFVTVAAGEGLMRKYPPTPGEAGTTVTGKVIPPKAGKALEFSAMLKGAVIDENDPDLLLASLGGRPVPEAQGVNVEQAVTFKKVDLTTGNIHFDGSVEIDGGLGKGMLIDATGDVLINGMLEQATVKAGRDVMIGKGVLGNGEPVDEDGRVTEQATQVHCGGGFHARFIQNAYIHAGKSVETMEHIVHSDVTAADQVVVGEEQGKKGQVLGGVVRARNSIQANSIGSPASIYTELEVGYDPQIYRRHIELSQKANELVEEKGKLKSLISQLLLKGAGKSEIFKKANNTLVAVQDEMAELSGKLAEVEKMLEMVESATVSVSNGIFSNTLLHVAGEVLLLKHDKGVGTFSIHKGELIFR